jgi:multiple sugar transport system substrate-binding protein
MAGACAIGGTQPVKAPRTAVALDYWSRFGGTGTNGEMAEFEKRRLAIFQEQHAPITVTRTEVANHTQLLDKLTVAYVSGSGPDLTSIGSGAMTQMAHPGFLLPLDGYASVKSAVADFFESGRRIGTYKGKLHGLTYVVDMRLAAYRKDLLAEVGVRAERAALPRTWEQFRDLARRLSRWEAGELKRAGFDVPKGDEAFFLTIVRQQGKDALNADMTKAAFDGVEGERALQLAVDLMHKDRVDAFQRPPIAAGLEPLASPVVASRWTNAQVLAGTRRAGLDPAQLVITDLTPEWTGRPTATGYLGGTWIAPGKQNKDVDATLEALLFLTDYDHLTGVAEINGSVPPLKSADGKWAPSKDPLVRPYFEAQERAWTFPSHPKWVQIRLRIGELMREAMEQKRGVKEAVLEMAAVTNTQLAMP